MIEEDENHWRKVGRLYIQSLKISKPIKPNK